MPMFRIALLVCCLVAPFLIAQEPAAESPVSGQPHGGMRAPETEKETGEGDAEAERRLGILSQAARNVRLTPRAEAVSGALNLEAATGVQLEAFSSTPNVFMRLGTSDANSAFNVTNAGGNSLFNLRGDGYTILRRDQDGVTGFEINNANPGSSLVTASAQLRFFAGTGQTAKIASIGSGSTTAQGGAGALQVWNFANAPIVFGAAGTERMRINADGTTTLNYAGDHTSRLLVQHGQDNSSAVFITHQPLVEANATQTDAGLQIQTQQTVNPGVTNSGSLIGLHSWTNLIGTGALTNLTGAIIQTGTAVAGTISDAIGLRMQSILSGGGTIGTGYAVFLDDVLATNDYGFFQAAASDTNYFGGNVLIGGSPSAATSPYALTVSGDTRFVGSVPGTATNFSGGTIHLQGFPTQLKFGNNQFIQDNAGGNMRIFAGANLQVDTSAGGDITMIPGSGNLRVTGAVITTAGVTADSATIGPVGGNPATSRFTVHGSAHFNGTVTGSNIKAHYQDVAEWVPSTSDLDPGTVVILNRGRNNEVMASTGAYDTTVAGVVSAQPGLSLGVEGEGKEQIATTGRVMVRVDARVKPIAVGDLLVTSDTPGTAMRSEPMSINGRAFHQPGTILGKALEPLEGGVGEILVLLSMQ